MKITYALPTTDRRFWRSYYSECEGSHARDGVIEWNGRGFVSETGKIASHPHCVVDNFGFLHPLPQPMAEGLLK